MHVQNWYQLGVRCLNELSLSALPSACEDRVSLAQQECLHRLRAVYSECPSPPCELSAAEAHSALCGRFSCYPDEQGDPVAFERSLVALPSIGEPVDMSGLLEGRANSSWRNWRSELLREPAEAADLLNALGLRKPHSD
eukprot:2650519-Amphidinium_carterae.1